MNKCACGCGETIPSVDAKGRPRRFALHHQNRAKTAAQRRASKATIERVRPREPWNRGRSYVIGKREVYANKASWTTALKRRFGDRCMRCGWDEAPCDSHHIEGRAVGGLHRLDNGVVLCPNCHRIAHQRLSADELHALRDATWPIAPVV